MASYFSTSTTSRIRPARSGESTLRLEANQAYSFKKGPQSVKITAVAGNLWITQNGEDYVLQAGEAFTVSHRGQVVIEGLPEGMACLSAV